MRLNYTRKSVVAIRDVPRNPIKIPTVTTNPGERAIYHLLEFFWIVFAYLAVEYPFRAREKSPKQGII